MKRVAIALLMTATGCHEATEPRPPSDPDAPPRAMLTTTCSHRWAAPVSGNWTDAANWDTGTVPDYTANVCIDVAGTYTVTFDSSASMRGLVLGNGVDDIRLEVNANVGDDIAITNTLDVTENARLVHDQSGVIVAIAAFASVRGTFQMNASIYASRLVIEPTGTLTGWGTITLYGYGSLYNDGTIIVPYGRNLYIGGLLLAADVQLRNGEVTGGGSLHLVGSPVTYMTVRWSGGELDAASGDTTRSMVQVYGPATLVLGDDVTGHIGANSIVDTVHVAGTVGSDARLHLRGGNRIRLTGLTASQPMQNDGRIDMTTDTLAFSTLSVSGSVRNAGAVVTMAGGADVLLDSLANSGVFSVLGATRLRGTTLRNAGIVSAPVALDFVNSDYVSDAGTMTGTLRLDTNSELSGSGTLDVVQSTGARVSPGTTTLPIGALTVRVLTLDGTSRTVVHISGTGSAQRDVIHATGALTLAGTLQVNTTAPFIGGVCGQTISALTHAKTATRTGSFASLLGASVGSGRAWRVHHAPNVVQLVGFDPSRALGISPVSIALTEGGAAFPIDVCLGRGQPAGTVTVTPIARFGQVSATPNPMTFTTANWSLPQRLSVRALDDLVAEPARVDSLQMRLTSIDTVYSGNARAQLHVDVTDNDAPTDLAVSLVTSPSTVTLNQTFEARYRVSNLGVGGSTGSTFTVAPMAGVTFQGNTPGATCSATAGLLTCTVGALAAGAQVEFLVVYRATAAGAHANQVSIAGIEYDALAGNNGFTWNITVN